MFRRVTAVGFVLALLAAACGDDAATPADPTTTTTSAAAEESSTTTPTTTADDGPVAAVESRPTPLVDVAWITDRAVNPHVLVDVRTQVNFEAGHIPGARSLPAATLNRVGGPVPTRRCGSRRGHAQHGRDHSGRHRRPLRRRRQPLRGTRLLGAHLPRPRRHQDPRWRTDRMDGIRRRRGDRPRRHRRGDHLRRDG